jgi:hypothetical protein
MVHFQDGEEIFETLSNAAPEKGEFETTASYEQRLAEVRAKVDLSAPIIAQAIYDPDMVEYDADRQVFIVKTYAWDNLGVASDVALPRGNRWGIETSLLGNAEVALKKEEIPTGSYEATNSYGATTTVLQMNRFTFAVFDRAYPRTPGKGNGTAEAWRATTLSGNSPAIEISVPLDQAQATKQGMKVGIAFQPREPFVASGVYTNTPTITNPREITATTNLLIGNILCAVISDPDGIVIGTADPGY